MRDDDNFQGNPFAPASDWKIPTGVQQSRDRDRLAILEQEFQDNPNDSALLREVTAERKKQGGSVPAIDADNFKGNPFAGEQPTHRRQTGASGSWEEQPTLEQVLGPSDFTKAFSSTPARMLKSGMQMVGLGDYVPEAVSRVAAEGDKSVLGRIAGDIAGTGGIKAGTGALVNTIQRLNAARGFLPAVGRTAEAAGYGAAQGAITSPDEQGEAALWGAGGGAGGHVLGRALAKIRGGAKPTEDALQFQRNIEGSSVAGQPPPPVLTPGQLAPKGGWLREMENAISQVPFVGAPMRARQEDAMRGFQQFSRYAAMPRDEQGAVLDSFVQGFGGGKTIDELKRGFNAAYDDVLGGIQIAVGRNSIDNAPILKSARELQQVESALKEEGFRLRKSPSLDSQQEGQRLLAEAEAVRNLWRPQVAAQNPEAAMKLQFIDDAYSRFIPIKGASQKTNATLVQPENYSPAMLLRETRKNPNLGAQYQNALARQAEEFVGSTVKPRSTFGGQLGLGGVGLASVLTGQHVPAAVAGGLAAAYGTKTGQKVARGLQRALTADETAAVLRALRRGIAPAAISSERQPD